MNLIRVSLSLVFCLPALMSAGCGGDANDYKGPERFAVSGTVNLDCSPLDYGTISFIPTNESTQRVAGGEISAGAFSVAAPFGPNEGEYKVTVSSIRRDDSAGAIVDEDESPAEEATEAGDDEAGSSEEYDPEGNTIEAGQRIASDFSDAEITSLTATISSGENVLTFEVQSVGR